MGRFRRYSSLITPPPPLTRFLGSCVQPLVHSAKTQVGRGLGWHRAGSRISYYANTIRRGRSGKTYYTLTFTLVTEYDNDLVHVAHCYPYTYTDLQRYLRVGGA